MKGKQISFLAQSDDLILFEKYLNDCGFVIIANPMPDTKPYIVESLFFDDVKFPFIKYLCLNQQKDLVSSTFVDNFNYYMTNALNSPVVEIILPKVDLVTNEFKEGRLYYTEAYFDGLGNRIEKDIAFLNAAKNIFGWIRKNFKKLNSGEFIGVYLSNSLKNHIL